MKYLLTVLIISALCSCKKDKEDKPEPVPPSIVNIETSSEDVNGTLRPKFTITLNIPDTATVLQLELFQNAKFPVYQSGKIVSPKSTQYTIIDMAATYPPAAPVKYFAFFTMKNYSYVGYYPFEVQ